MGLRESRNNRRVSWFRPLKASQASRVFPALQALPASLVLQPALALPAALPVLQPPVSLAL